MADVTETRAEVAERRYGWGWCSIHRWVTYPHRCRRDRVTVNLRTKANYDAEWEASRP